MLKCFKVQSCSTEPPRTDKKDCISTIIYLMASYSRFRQGVPPPKANIHGECHLCSKKGAKR